MAAVWVSLRSMKNRPHGFTLIEILVVLALIGILVAMAIPSFNTMLMRRSVQSAANALVTDIRYARSEALQRSARVSICSLAAGSEDTCSVGPGPGIWVNGWMVFVDTGATPNVRDAGEEIVRVQQPPPNILSITSGVLRVFTFQANGIAIAANDTLTVIPTTAGSATNNRVVCTSFNGRPSIRDEGMTGC